MHSLHRTLRLSLSVLMSTGYSYAHDCVFIRGVGTTLPYTKMGGGCVLTKSVFSGGPLFCGFTVDGRFTFGTYRQELSTHGLDRSELSQIMVGVYNRLRDVLCVTINNLTRSP